MHPAAALVLFALVSLSSAADPTAFCWITISNGTEYCYYYHPTGYECDYGPTQDPDRRNLTSCDAKGLCYVPLAGETEVCYYSTPYGYDCYFELIPALVANMTHCDLIKANIAPEITYGTAPGTGTEDLPQQIAHIRIDDADAPASQSEPNKGYIEVTLEMTKGYIWFDINDDPINDLGSGNPPASLTSRDVMFTNVFPTGYGVNFLTGNGTDTTSSTLKFQGFVGAVRAMMANLWWVGELHHNSARTPANTLKITVDDLGNTGGTPEITTDTIALSLTAIPDDPTIFIPGACCPTVTEDNDMSISDVEVTDVDYIEDGTELAVQISVTKGRLALPNFPTTISTICDAANPPSVLPCYGGTPLWSMISIQGKPIASELELWLDAITYTPDTNANDETGSGVDILTVRASDGGAFSSTLTTELHVNPDNDAPIVDYPETLVVDEDTPLPGINITITDVDTDAALSLFIGVTNGGLVANELDWHNPPDLGGPGPWYDNLTFPNVTLAQIADILASTNYTGNTDFNGMDNLRVVVDDNDPSSPQTTVVNVPLTVEAVNDAPFIEFCDGGGCNPDGPVNHTVAITAKGTTLSFNGADMAHPRLQLQDVDAGSATLQLLLSVEHGHFDLPGPRAGISLTLPPVWPAGCNAANWVECPDTILAVGTRADWNTALATLVYFRADLPTPGHEWDEMIVAVNDLKNTGKGKAESDFAELIIPVA